MRTIRPVTEGQNMTNDENERAAYLAGNLAIADLYHRLDHLAQAVGETVAELEEVKKELIRAENRAEDLQNELDRDMA
jgi:uncharacterized membrane protein